MLVHCDACDVLQAAGIGFLVADGRGLDPVTPHLAEKAAPVDAKREVLVIARCEPDGIRVLAHRYDERHACIIDDRMCVAA